jgi:D-threo-aldose 1-dehydrogenase
MDKIIWPKVIFGTSGLGNLYVAPSDTDKLAIVEACIYNSVKPAVFDSAGKYGAGLALESLGKCLHQLSVKPEDVLISNKLGWLRTELKTPEPTFEPGVWRDLKFDAVQRISYKGIIECYEQGNALLNGYNAALVSVHDPDEYIESGQSQSEKEKLYKDVLEAYQALHDLKRQKVIKAIGIGSKSWRVIEKVANEVDLDWIMLANSMTVYSHPPELVAFMEKLKDKGIAIINSAVFNGGFLIGSDYYNYEPVNPVSHPELYQWRARFYELCAVHELQPAAVCAGFGLNAPGVVSIALNTTNQKRIAGNIAMPTIRIPAVFWADMKELRLMDNAYKHF